MVNAGRRLFLGMFPEEEILAGYHTERVKKAKERFTGFSETETEYVYENGHIVGVNLFIRDERGGAK